MQLELILHTLRLRAAEINQGALVQKFGFSASFAQVIFLADTSIVENIAFGVPVEQIDHTRLRQVAQKAQIA